MDLCLPNFGFPCRPTCGFRKIENDLMCEEELELECNIPTHEIDDSPISLIYSEAPDSCDTCEYDDCAIQWAEEMPFGEADDFISVLRKADAMHYRTDSDYLQRICTDLVLETWRSGSVSWLLQVRSLGSSFYCSCRVLFFFFFFKQHILRLP